MLRIQILKPHSAISEAFLVAHMVSVSFILIVTKSGSNCWRLPLKDPVFAYLTAVEEIVLSELGCVFRFKKMIKKKKTPPKAFLGGEEVFLSLLNALNKSL